jgi:hypothetical protein
MIRNVALLAVAAVVSTVFLVALSPVGSEEGERSTMPVPGGGLLDGLSFDGMFGPPDGSSDRPDMLHFRDGRFWSKSCVPCGFLPGLYKAWTTDEGVRFEGILTSADRGRFHYQGVVRDGNIYARLNWRKERWYWTIDKDFRFEGVRIEKPMALSAEEIKLVALTADPESNECRP